MSLKRVLAFASLLLSASSVHAQGKYSIDTDECGGEPSAKISVLKTQVRANKSQSLKFYGKLELRRNADDAKANRCHVIYHLFASEAGKPFHEAKLLEWDTEEGETAGIDLIGFSPDQSKFAADFLLAEGDGVEHRPLVYDLNAHTAAYRPLEDRIQKRINGCDQNEDFVAVTDRGEAVFAIPPSEYDDSPQCGDKGLWHFNLQTGQVYRIKKISGVKWQ